MITNHPVVNWARTYQSRSAGPEDNTWTARYSLKHLARRDVIPEGAAYLEENGLRDMVWEVTWADDSQVHDSDLGARLAQADGYVIFVHGWTGNHRVWEMLPCQIVSNNPRLIAISVDHNGFGESAFVRNPRINECNPPAAMRRLEQWIELLKIRRQPGDTRLKTINLVGHSMGGATLFYANPIPWRFGEQTRYALAPALLLEDETHQVFYQALGLGIGLVDRIGAFEIIEQAVKPQILNRLTVGSSPFIYEEHKRQYQATPRATTAATFTAMGVLRDREIPRNFDLFRVMLGHRDPLVGILPMMDLLMQLEFPASNVRVVAGSHYMFSLGKDTVFQHAQNRELVVNDILELHDQALHMQKTGQRVG